MIACLPAAAVSNSKDKRARTEEENKACALIACRRLFSVVPVPLGGVGVLDSPAPHRRNTFRYNNNGQRANCCCHRAYINAQSCGCPVMTDTFDVCCFVSSAHN